MFASNSLIISKSDITSKYVRCFVQWLICKMYICKSQLKQATNLSSNTDKRGDPSKRYFVIPRIHINKTNFIIIYPIDLTRRFDGNS